MNHVSTYAPSNSVNFMLSQESSYIPSQLDMTFCLSNELPIIWTVKMCINLYGNTTDCKKPPKNTRTREEASWEGSWDKQTRPKLRFFSLGEPECVITLTNVAGICQTSLHVSLFLHVLLSLTLMPHTIWFPSGLWELTCAIPNPCHAQPCSFSMCLQCAPRFSWKPLPWSHSM